MVFAPVSGAVVRSLSATSDQTDSFSQRFTVGQTIRGIVLRELPEGKTLVNFAGQHVVMQLTQPLGKGESFLATVEQVAPTLILKILDEPLTQRTDGIRLQADRQSSARSLNTILQTLPGTLNTAQLKSYLVGKRPFVDMLATLQKQLINSPAFQQADAALRHRLQTTLNLLLPEAAFPPDANELKAQINQSGMNYEANVRLLLSEDASSIDRTSVIQDLKGQLLELAQALDQRPSQQGDTTFARQHVQQALQNIEFQQLANLFARQENQSLLLQFAHPAFPASHTAKLFFRVDSEAKSSQHDRTQDYTLVFLLDFTCLGNIRIDATIRGQQVSAAIKTENEAVARFIEARTDTLSAHLQELGFHTEVNCYAQETVSLDVDDALTHALVLDPSQLVDIKA